MSPVILPLLPMVRPKKKMKKARANRKPIPEKIGNFITDVYEIRNLAKQRKSIVFKDTVIPAAVINNWNYSVVISCITNKSFKYYNKE